MYFLQDWDKISIEMVSGCKLIGCGDIASHHHFGIIVESCTFKKTCHKSLPTSRRIWFFEIKMEGCTAIMWTGLRSYGFGRSNYSSWRVVCKSLSHAIYSLFPTAVFYLLLLLCKLYFDLMIRIMTRFNFQPLVLLRLLQPVRLKSYPRFA